MTGNRNRTCASCAESPLQASMDTAGVATCAIRQQPQEWSDRFCVLYERAKDLPRRRALVEKLIQNQ